MTQLIYENVGELSHLPPFAQIAGLYQHPGELSQEIENYLIAGSIIATPELFLIFKPIKKDIPPESQWYVEDPDCYYVRWASGQGSLKKMMDLVKPLPWVTFQRVTKNGDLPYRYYEWNKIYRNIARFSHGSI